jgi:membrane associated rhomboid family serine protease
MEIGQEIKKFLKNSNLHIKLIIANVIVFISVNLVFLILYLLNVENFTSQDFISWLAVPAGFKQLLFRFWTPVTYMFLHEGFWHILGNMLWLYFLGTIFLFFIDQKKLFAVYILGGLSGAALYILAYNVFPVFKEVREYSVALGASASVSAIVIAISTYQPNYEIRPFGIFTLKLKWLAIIFVLVDLISIPKGNAGGHIAHLGGALYGFYFAMQLSKGRDVTKSFNKVIDICVSLFSGNKNPKMKVEYNSKKENFKYETTSSNIPKSDSEYNKTKSDEQNEIDRILDKISKFGYDSLSSKEKEFLFKFSNKK